MERTDAYLEAVWSADCNPYFSEAFSNRMGIAGQHRLDAVAGDLGKVGVVDAGSSQVRHIAVAALMGADV
jgi:hypothetical protein